MAARKRSVRAFLDLLQYSFTVNAQDDENAAARPAAASGIRDQIIQNNATVATKLRHIVNRHNR